ncbi:hypothetical protein DVH24_032524 [Malus domestica]|uniref:Uncharacterized protein n=1 Tax=Malus domestica TaxID=3750 RepID=A0A498J673_MALDO|nr:hypothetical protein DVH24_032524 [Malus domestica]
MLSLRKLGTTLQAATSSEQNRTGFRWVIGKSWALPGNDCRSSMLSEIIYLDGKSHKIYEVDGEDDMNDKLFETLMFGL